MVILEVLTIPSCVVAKIAVGDVSWPSPALACSFLIHHSAVCIIGREYYSLGVMILVIQLVE